MSTYSCSVPCASVVARAITTGTLVNVLLHVHVVDEWAESRVQEWLHAIGMSHHAAMFTAATIDGDALLDIDDGDIASHLVGNDADRLLVEIHALREKVTVCLC